jgi:hypothetical protein
MTVHFVAKATTTSQVAAHSMAKSTITNVWDHTMYHVPLIRKTNVATMRKICIENLCRLSMSVFLNQSFCFSILGSIHARVPVFRLLSTIVQLHISLLVMWI